MLVVRTHWLSPAQVFARMNTWVRGELCFKKMNWKLGKMIPYQVLRTDLLKSVDPFGPERQWKTGQKVWHVYLYPAFSYFTRHSHGNQSVYLKPGGAYLPHPSSRLESESNGNLPFKMCCSRNPKGAIRYPSPCPKLMTALDSRNSKSPWKDCPLYRGRGVISNDKESPRRSHHTVGIRFILCIMLVTTYVVFGPLCRVRLREWSPRSHLDHDGLTICSSCSLPQILFLSDQSSC